MRDAIFHILFVWYPYFCLTTFFVGSLIRFDRDQYTWKASSSQMLRKRQLFWGSNLFHFGILFLMLGHTVGLLTPTSIYTLVMTVPQKQLVAVVAGGIAGVICFIGLTMLLHRRLFDARIRQTSTVMDLAVLVILWVQLSLGLITLPFSFGHRDGSAMLTLSHWAQGIVTLQPVDPDDAAKPRMAVSHSSRSRHDDLPRLPVLAPRAHLVGAGLVSRPTWLSGGAHQAAFTVRSSAPFTAADRGVTNHECPITRPPAARSSRPSPPSRRPSVSMAS